MLRRKEIGFEPMSHLPFLRSFDVCTQLHHSLRRSLTTPIYCITNVLYNTFVIQRNILNYVEFLQRCVECASSDSHTLAGILELYIVIEEV